MAIVKYILLTCLFVFLSYHAFKVLKPFFKLADQKQLFPLFEQIGKDKIAKWGKDKNEKKEGD